MNIKEGFYPDLKDRNQGYLDIAFTKDRLIELYLDYVNNFLTECYGKEVWTNTDIHQWLAHIKPKYMIDINRDRLLQDNYKGMPHNLIVGISRIKAVANRFKIFN